MSALEVDKKLKYNCPILISLGLSNHINQNISKSGNPFKQL
jgi:hypothetical protein